MDNVICIPTTFLLPLYSASKVSAEGGYIIMNGIARKRKLNQEEKLTKRLKKNVSMKRPLAQEPNENKRQRLIENEEVFDLDSIELVNVEYSILFKTYFSDNTRYHRIKGFLRNLSLIHI